MRTTRSSANNMVREFQASEFLSTIVLHRKTLLTRSVRLKIEDLYDCADRFHAAHIEYRINLDDYSIDAFRRKYSTHVCIYPSEIHVRNLSGTFVHQLSLNRPSEKVVKLFIEALNG